MAQRQTEASMQAPSVPVPCGCDVILLSCRLSLHLLTLNNLDNRCQRSHCPQFDFGPDFWYDTETESYHYTIVLGEMGSVP